MEDSALDGAAVAEGAYQRGYAAALAGQRIDLAEWRGDSFEAYQDGYGRGLLAKIKGEAGDSESAAVSPGSEPFGAS